MVIAPIVGPVLTAAVGATTGDREMLLHSVWIQAAGITVAIVGAGAFSYGLQAAGFFPEPLGVTTIDLIALRVAPNLVTIAIGLAAGAAGAFGLTTKGPTSLIGMMIAALIPAAATVGIATAWNKYRIAVGSLLLLLLTMITINIGAFVVLWWLDYRPEQDKWLLPSRWSLRWILIVDTAVLLIASIGLVGAASYQQIAFEQTVNEVVHQIFDKSEYGSAEPVAVRIQYSGIGPFGSPETITITASRTADGSDPPSVTGELDQRIAEATDREVDVWIEFVEYQRSDDSTPAERLDADSQQMRGQP